MRKEFESDLAKTVATKGQKKTRGKALLFMALAGVLLVSGFAAVTAVSAADMDQTKTQDKLQLMDGTGDNCQDDCDGDGICDQDCDPDCVNDLDGDGVCDQDCVNDLDGDGICDQDCINQ